MKKVVLALGIIILIYLDYNLPQPVYSFLGRINTTYTDQFAYPEFRQIKSGMSKEEIMNQLGDPFWISPPMHECFHYSKESKISLPPYVWTSLRVCFDEADIVVETYENAYGV